MFKSNQNQSNIDKINDTFLIYFYKLINTIALLNIKLLTVDQNILKLFKLNIQHFQYIQLGQNLQTFAMHLKPNPEDNGVITKQFLKKLCRSDFKQYYSTPSLNDILYLHYKGFQKIDNLQEFTGLKVIYLEGNAIKKIQNLQKLTTLRCLYLQENLIRQISGLDYLTNLVNLNLSDNMIQKITGLSKLQKLSTFQIKRNRIGADGLSDLTGLLQCPSISALDISDNKIQTAQVVSQILEKMPNLNVVYLQNNGFNKKVSHYRKALISKIPSLKYIDDKPVFDDQKRFSQAWARGGLEEERKQRALYKIQEQQKQIKQHQQFRAMIERYKIQNKKKQQQSEQSSDNLSDSQEQSLQTYNTPSESKQASQKTSQHQSETQSQNQESQKKSVKQGEKSIKSLGQFVLSSKQLGSQIQTQQTKKKDTSKYLDELD